MCPARASRWHRRLSSKSIRVAAVLKASAPAVRRVQGGPFRSSSIGNHRTFLMESVHTTGSPKPKGVLIESTYKAFVKALLKCEVNDLLLETI